VGLIDLQAAGGRARRWLATDRAAATVFWLGFAAGCLLIAAVGHYQWFVRDDWAFVLRRWEQMKTGHQASALFTPQDGHWMTVPVLVWQAIQGVFGLRSYIPFLLTAVLTHLGCVLAVRAVCRRAGASPWSTTLVCLILVVFGSGFDNIVFAVQFTYNLSLLCLLWQVLLVDHDGRPDRRDLVGSLVCVVGVMSSGFGPIFVGAVALLLVIRRRWKATVIAVAPATIALAWWWATWGSDRASDTNPGSVTLVPEFVQHGLSTTFAGLAGIPSAGVLVMIGTIVVIFVRRMSFSTRSLLVSLNVTAFGMFAAIAVERVGAGIDSAGAPRYVYMAAFLLAPALARSVDELPSSSVAVRQAALCTLALSACFNAGRLASNGRSWALRQGVERQVLGLIAGSGQAGKAPPETRILAYSIDVAAKDIPLLVRDQAITPRVPATDFERRLVTEALSGHPGELPIPLRSSP
jgi:drug/metabolite transporter superfamily protein YnfA